MKFFFAWRYFKAKKTTQAINIIAWVSMFAITVITAAFIILLSVFNGFEDLVKSLYASFYADVRAVPAQGTLFQVTDAQWQQISQVQGVRAISGVVEEKALLQNGDYQTIIYLKGVDDDYTLMNGIKSKLIRGQFELGNEDQPGLVLGLGVEASVMADVERSIYPMTVYLFRTGVPATILDPFQSFASDQITATGTFLIQQDIDQKYALTNIGFLRRMLSYPDHQYSSIEIAIRSSANEASVVEALQHILGKEIVIETRYQQNKDLYGVMRMEKWAIYGILTLMLFVAAFTLIGSLSMLVMEKQKDIRVLKALGASAKTIQGIFLRQGFILGGIGAGLGMLLGLFICWLQIHFKWIGIQGGTFLVDAYPVKVTWTDIGIVMLTVMVVSMLAAWFPSRKASRFHAGAIQE